MRADSRSGAGFEVAATALLGLVAALGSILWVSTGLGCVLSGKAWPRLGVGTVASALLRFPAHLSEPRLAWPAAIRSELGGRLAF